MCSHTDVPLTTPPNQKENLGTHEQRNQEITILFQFLCFYGATVAGLTWKNTSNTGTLGTHSILGIKKVLVNVC